MAEPGLPVCQPGIARMIGYAGLSHLGIVSSITSAHKGHQVIGYHPSPDLCLELTAGRLPFLEPGLTELLEANRSGIRFTSDISELSSCELIFVSLDVPTDEGNRSDLSPVRHLIDEVMPAAASGTTLVVLSQVPPGFTRRLARACTERNDGERLNVYYQVETLVFGNAVERALHPERFIVGREDGDDRLPQVYRDWLAGFDVPVLQMRYESAELAKTSINMFLASSVSVTNTLAEVCEAIGADWAEIIPVLRSDRRIGKHAYLNPGLGLSGGNLERDLATIVNLATEFGTDASVVEATFVNSGHRRDWVLKALHSRVISLCASPAIAIWGLAYKADTSSTKNSPSLDLIASLRPFPTRVYDPQAVLDAVPLSGVTQDDSALDACRGADALVIMTPWAEFAAVDLELVKDAMTGRAVVDPLGVLDRNRCNALGFSYASLGSPARSAGPEVV